MTNGVVGWCEVLGKLSVPGRPFYLDNSRERAYCACSMCRWGLFEHFFSHLSFLFSFVLSGRRPDIDWNTVAKAIKPLVLKFISTSSRCHDEELALIRRCIIVVCPWGSLDI